MLFVMLQVLYRNIIKPLWCKYACENIPQQNYLCNVGPKHTSNFLWKNNLWNLLLIWLGQHCTRKLPLWMLAHSPQTNFHRKIIYNFSGSIWATIAQGNYLCNVGLWLTDNFYEEINLYIQCCSNKFGAASGD